MKEAIKYLKDVKKNYEESISTIKKHIDEYLGYIEKKRDMILQHENTIKSIESAIKKLEE